MALNPQKAAELLKKKNIRAALDRNPNPAALPVATNQNKSLFEKQVKENEFVRSGGFQMPEKGTTLQEQARASQQLSNMFGVPSGVPNSSLSSREQERREGFSQGIDSVQQTRAINPLASDFTVNNGRIAINPTQLGRGGVVQEAFNRQQAERGSQIQDQFNNFKSSLEQPPEVKKRIDELKKQLQDETNSPNFSGFGNSNKALVAELGQYGVDVKLDRTNKQRQFVFTDFRSGSDISRQTAIARGGFDYGNGVDGLLVQDIENELFNSFKASPEFLALSAEKGMSPDELEQQIRQKGFTGAEVDQASMALARQKELELAGMTPKELAEREDLEYNIRYQEDLAEAERVIDKQVQDEIDRQMGGMDFASEAAKKKQKEIIEATVKANGKESLNETKRALDQSLERSKRNYIDNLEQAREKARIEQLQESAKTPAEKNAEELEAYIQQEQLVNPNLKRAYLANKWNSINKYEEKDLNAKANVEAWETMLQIGEVNPRDQEQTYQQAIDLTGDAESAYELMKTTGNTSTANEFRAAWTEKRYGTEAMTRQQAIGRVNDMFSGEESSADAVDAFVSESKEQFDDVFIANQLQSIADSYGANPLVKQVAQDYLDAEFGKYLEDTNEVKYREFDGNLYRETADGLVLEQKGVQTEKAKTKAELEARYLAGDMNETEMGNYEKGLASLERLKRTTESESEITDIDKQTATGLVERYKSGELSYKEAIEKAPTNGAKSSFAIQADEGDVKPEVSEDSNAIQTIDRQINMIDDLLKDNAFELISGASRGGLDVVARLGGKKGNAIAAARTLVSTQTLDALINAKAEGATFGALSNEELKMLQNSASSLAGMLDRDKNNEDIIGFIGTEGRVKQELTNIRNVLAINKMKKTGEMPQGVLNVKADAFDNLTADEALQFEQVFKDNALDVIEAINEQGFSPEAILRYYEPLGKPQASISGVVTGEGSKFWKYGLDVVVEGGYNASIPSPIGGKVIEVVSEFKGDPNSPIEDGMAQNKGWGNRVKVVDDEGNEHWFSHLAGSDLQLGQTINAGDIVGRQGNTGNTYSTTGGSGTHLDYTIKKPDGTYKNPKEVRKIAGLTNEV